MDPRFTRYADPKARAAFKSDVVDPFYRQEEDYDWVEVTDHIRGFESFMHRFRQREFLSYLRRYGQGGAYLDVGCGTGLMLRHLPAGAVGIDLNPRNVVRAKEHAPRARVEIADAEHLPFPDALFTTVICTEVLEHLVFPDQAVAEINRVLKPGGVFFGSVPRRSALWRLRALSSTCDANEPFHNEMSRSELNQLLSPFPRRKIRGTFWLMHHSFIAWKNP